MPGLGQELMGNAKVRPNYYRPAKILNMGVNSCMNTEQTKVYVEISAFAQNIFMHTNMFLEKLSQQISKCCYRSKIMN